MNHLRAITVASFLAATVLPATAVEISGAGATFPFPIYAKWAETYAKDTGTQLNYQSIGSGGGIKQIVARTVTFGASDAPLKGAGPRQERSRAVSDGHGRHRAGREFRGGQGRATLILDGQTLAKIFLGDIKSWDDPGDQKTQSQRQASVASNRRRPPIRRFRYNLQFHLLFGGGQSRLEIEGRFRDLGGMADGDRRQGQRRRVEQREPNQELDRLCRVRLRASEQDDLHKDGKQGR